jgi:peptide/nickel transport system substrate-binding protein
MDTKPLDNVMVRKALNIAINRQEIVDKYYGGNAEMFNYPMHRDWVGYFRPLEEMPAGVRKLFSYDPAKAKALLTEAGFPNGFSLDVQVNGANSAHLDLLSIVAGHLDKIGVKLNIKPMEYASYLAVLKNGKHSAGYMMNSGHISPIGTLLRSFGDIYWNASNSRRGWAKHSMRGMRACKCPKRGRLPPKSCRWRHSFCCRPAIVFRRGGRG